MNIVTFIYQALCGAVAAAGFGILFNVRFRLLPWCAASGALTLVVRAICLRSGWSLEGATFAGALSVAAAVQLLRKRIGVAHYAIDVVGCIPMVPGSFAAKAILGLFAVTIESAVTPSATLVVAIQYALRVVFTIGAIGTGLAIPTLLLRVGAPRLAPRP